MSFGDYAAILLRYFYERILLEVRPLEQKSA